MWKRLCLLSLVVLLAIGLSSSAFGEKLVILHTNDTHSSLFPFGPQDQYGGIARMSTMIKKLRSQNKNVLALNAGDVFVGTFEFNKYLGYPELKIMEGLYDAMALGNHEFDLGPEILGYVLAGFNPLTAEPFGAPVALPIVCANVELKDYPVLQTFVQPSMIKKIANLQIGIFAVISNDPVYYSPYFADLFQDPYLYAGIMAADLRKLGCDVVIAISHLGKMFDLLALSEVPGIDIIVGGHSHDEFFAPNINGKIIVQAGEFGKNLGELKVEIDLEQEPPVVTVLGHTLHPINREIRKDPSLLGYLNELREGIYEDPRFGPVYSQHVAKAMWDHEEMWVLGDPHRQPSHRDTPLGNLVTDAIRTGIERAGYPVDCALEANGYIGHKIFAGKVVGNDLMRALPYGFDPVSGLGFKIKIVDLYGVELLSGLEYTVQMVEYTDELSLQASGLAFEYNSGAPPFSRVDMSSIRINGNLFEPYGLYRIALNEKLLELLAGLGLDLTGRVTDPSPDVFEFNLVKDYMRRLNHLAYNSVGRIIDTAELE
jgi:2',3'-cyclic-nucleotide 2'-phosphodiesterase (5'-nucleotidase family)